jgi:predicted P-loop ATPase
MSRENILKLQAAMAKQPEWLNECRRSASDDKKLGKLILDYKNALIPLRRDKRFADLFAYDEMLRSPVLLRPIEPSPPEGFAPRAMGDVDISYVQEALQTWFPRLSRETVAQAVETVASERRFHPVRDYLNSLEWDGVKRIDGDDGWLSVYFGAEKSEYVRGIGRMFAISMVARIFKPGCQCDYMVILEGEQGELKSSALRTLGDRWFSDSMPELSGSAKDVSLHLRNKWLIEIDELGAMSRADINRFKGFLTRPAERYRPPYAREDVHEPRMVIFAGTTNDCAYLRDTTGNRRYWPIRTGTIDIEALKADRDAIFAEALVLFRKGVQWWPTKAFEKKHIQPEQNDRLEGDAVDDDIARHLDMLKAAGKNATIGEVAVALGAETLKISMSEQYRIRRAMQAHGWTSGKQESSGRRPWVPKS